MQIELCGKQGEIPMENIHITVAFLHVANTFIQSHLRMQSNYAEEMKPVTFLSTELQVKTFAASESHRGRKNLVCPWQCINLHVNYEWPIYDTWWPGAIPKPTLNYTYNKLLLGTNQALIVAVSVFLLPLLKPIETFAVKWLNLAHR